MVTDPRGEFLRIAAGDGIHAGLDVVGVRDEALAVHAEKDVHGRERNAIDREPAVTEKLASRVFEVYIKRRGDVASPNGSL